MVCHDVGIRTLAKHRESFLMLVVPIGEAALQLVRLATDRDAEVALVGEAAFHLIIECDEEDIFVDVDRCHLFCHTLQNRVVALGIMTWDSWQKTPLNQSRRLTPGLSKP